MIWKLPSLQFIYNKAVETLRRFPETIVVSVVSGGALILLTHEVKPVAEFITKNIAFLILAIPLMFAVSVASEVYKPRLFVRITGLLLAALFLILFRLSMDLAFKGEFVSRYVQYQFGFHLLVAFIPFLRRGTVNGFWQWNRYLFLQFLFSLFYSIIIYIGLAVALHAIKSLLGVPVYHDVWMDLWVLIAFGFHTWFFLAGVPTRIEHLDEDTDYPNELRVLTQYVLLPLVTLYFLILYAYVGKIIFQQSWPKGTIGYLVSGASILGIFSLLLIHPLRDSSAYRWIKVYARYFYIALFPLVVVLLMAIWKRTTEYGLTEKRYFLFVIAIHLLIIAIYFTFSKTKNIKFIPISLCLLAFGTSIGPWGAYSVSLRWQKERLRELLQSVGGFENGKMKWGQLSVTYEQQKEISSILEYIWGTHGLEKLDSWSDSSLKNKNAYDVMDKFGLKLIYKWEQADHKRFSYCLDARPPEAESISGFDWYLGNTYYSTQSYSRPVPQEGLAVRMSSSPAAIRIFDNGQEWDVINVVPWIEKMDKENIRDYSCSSLSKMTMTTQTAKTSIKIIFDRIHGDRIEKPGSPIDFVVNNAETRVFIKKK